MYRGDVCIVLPRACKDYYVPSFNALSGVDADECD